MYNPGSVPSSPCRSGFTHDTGNVRADCLTAGDLLKTAENRIVIEGTALYDHVFSEIGGVGNLDNLKQGVFDDGVSQSGRNICDGSALFLRLMRRLRQGIRFAHAGRIAKKDF